MKYNLLFLLLFYLCFGFSQNQSTKIIAELDTEKHLIKIQQEIVFQNLSKDTLSSVYLHNWSNSYKNKRTPLSKRLIEDYDKSLYFAKKKNRGESKIINISSKYETTPFTIDEKIPDIVHIKLNNKLLPNDTLTLIATYIVKIPNDKFTHYGRNKNNYNLRYWYLIPAVYDSNWKLMSNYNMDDLYTIPTHYNITFKVPSDYSIQTDMEITSINEEKAFKTYHLIGEKRVDIELNINNQNTFKSIKTNDLEVISNLSDKNIKTRTKKAITERQIQFIEEFLGQYPHKKILLNKITYHKNPVYGVNQLPKLFRPFSDIFMYDIKLFKTLTNKYINNTLLTNRREDTWLNDGIQTFLMIKYVEKYYPEIKAIGKISNIWGIRSYQIAKIDFNDKYTFVHQFATRKNLDQSLNTRTDSLSTFNRKIVNKYKAGLGLQYLDDYLKKDIIQSSLKQFYKNNLLKKTHSKYFGKILKSTSTKDLEWFFGDYLNSNKKIDYTIKKVIKTGDSIKIFIKNKRKTAVPIALYGIKDKKIKFKQWMPVIDSAMTVTIPKGDFDRVSLNYENLCPEVNLKNNWKNLNSSLFNRPLQFRFLKDIDNPYYNQVFYNIVYNYNYYDGLILGASISNKTLFKKKWLYKVTPNYATKSKKLVGSFSLVHQNYPERTSIYRLRAGIAGSSFHYAPNLSFNKITPFVSLDFKRKSLRNVGRNNLSIRYLFIDREPEPNAVASESDSYQILNLRYNFFRPEIINDLRYRFDFQISKKFSKIGIDFRYRKLTDKNRQYDFRFFAGKFIYNKTDSDFFDFSLNRPTDYLFEYDYLGRSEDTGFLNQQYITAEGGFKSFFDENLANQWMITTNNSFSVWRWIEIYGDAGFYKNKSEASVFRYDSGIRFNFVHNILEVYFPLQSSNGFEASQTNYSSKIRFVLTLDPGKIFNFIKRGFY
jgi:hypothetical protein